MATALLGLCTLISIVAVRQMHDMQAWFLLGGTALGIAAIATGVVALARLARAPHIKGGRVAVLGMLFGLVVNLPLLVLLGWHG